MARAVVFVCTDAVATLKSTLLDPAATVTAVGNTSAALLLESATVVELVADVFRRTVQTTIPGPVTLTGAQLS